MITRTNNIFFQEWEKLRDFLLNNFGQANQSFHSDSILLFMLRNISLKIGCWLKFRIEKLRKVMINILMRNLERYWLIIRNKMWRNFNLWSQLFWMLLLKVLMLEWVINHQNQRKLKSQKNHRKRKVKNKNKLHKLNKPKKLNKPNKPNKSSRLLSRK